MTEPSEFRAHEDLTGTAPPEGPWLLGIHHVRLPVSDVTASRDWYREVFGLRVVLDEEEENEVVGSVLAMGDGTTLGLHHDPHRAEALAGFCLLAVAVGGPEILRAWDARLERMEIAHTPVTQGPFGSYIELSDPDGLTVQLHTPEHPSVEEA
jgi:catechol 2,3-dioxygenase-like lactoylglutathione lyase family enzyme